MLMEKRGNVINKFSSFISFTGNNHQIKLNWQVDLELENSMRLKVAADPDAKESFWAQYFLKMLLIQYQPDCKNVLNFNPGCIPTAKKHFSAYLQEACFKAAKDIHYEFKYIKHKYSLEECFQIANVAASSPSKFFKSFNLERETINVEAYAIAAFKRFIRNQIYHQDLEARRTRFSNYGLLKDLSFRELNEALSAQNFHSEKIILYRLVWQCFHEVFQPTPNSLARTRNPSQNDFAAIASYYNQRCNQLNVNHVSATDITIQEMLLTCINAAKNYRTKQYFSFEEDYYDISDATPSTWDILIEQEEWRQVQVIVDNLFTNMPQLCQIIFKLWQGLNLTQAEIANLLKSKYPELQKQYQVARQIKRYTRNILKEFAEQWNQVNLEIYLSCDHNIERIKSALDNCLESYCKQLFCSILDTNLKRIIHANQKKCDLDRDLNSLMEIKLKLIELFQHELEQNMCLETNSLSVVNQKLVDFVNEWIEKQDDFYE
ncbi:sigma-70 family RNA polymerase sigma factor [Rivularia sp. UHCC 0363]|uniref:sigma-70 family RNA polymerase sigma factor n=1 Tax=Rivularia sp. UHCC 0363 TaxID=3110244 RepID=UPI002B1EAC6E|nr:sigma-70 family RNA polymerase sigma factor [Rivularia sp. UHCC 0363]MEA5593309.1 sigma-70 family RNA polymerase sigma factor [Rivularia sp. UHCC 0363]